MPANIIDGRQLARRIQDEIKRAVAELKTEMGNSPGLGVVLVGDDPASAMYVRMKRRACERAGLRSEAQLLPAASTQAEVENAVRAFNRNPEIHGILVQLPLPAHIDEEAVLNEISLAKDVDGIHPVNLGRLGMRGREPTFTPATPTGVMALIAETGQSIEGKAAVVIGRSNIVGLPAALMLTNANATVTICHSRTRDLPALVKRADIVVAAIGRPEYVKGDWIKPGAIVIDVGSNSLPDPASEKGYRYVGDVEFAAARAVAGFITKVPGGVGPMTITMLLSNTLKAAQSAQNG
ncbi:MAG: bifunctional methylenetetrahydrofolate dehydrogenase/methenyltetrahydrofolate cyclohydrolase FolD [Chloroflexota bacterium]|nr:bifunctional methylenetetrahydrofolate dehydrogenase/methenyltetrahydrofolate cyclohydrolase FolD [Chloroflexota bacterium]MDE2948162.1 bifunctional methylenetetrahydrofolate dehydrogenase/methenyltetrahydrofolate cyclohydrolase FolD [Chloroflexota bacterium]